VSTANATLDLQNNLYWESLRSFLGPINPMLDDPKVSEVMINGDKIFYESGGKVNLSDVHIDNSKLIAAVRNLAQFVGKEMTEDTLHLAARLPDGSRVQVVLPPCSHTGVCFAIRKFSRKMLKLDDLVSWGALNEKAARWLEIVVQMKKNMLISGGTGSGKTTLLNILASMIPADERILIMEDVCELQIDHNHLVSLETRHPTGNPPRGGVSMRDLVMIALRMRPDRVIVGEVRGGEAMDLLQAMSTGHSGSMGTIHANDPHGGLRRMETLVSYAGDDIPLTAIRSQVSSALEVIVQVNRFGDGSRRLTHISEVLPLDLQGNFQIRDIFKFVLKGKTPEGKLIGDIEPTGEDSLFLDQIPLYGIDLDPEIFKK
jgi:pilus assembly protein CpaF